MKLEAAYMVWKSHTDRAFIGYRGYGVYTDTSIGVVVTTDGHYYGDTCTR